MAIHPSAVEAARSASFNIEAVRESFPFRGDFLSAQTGTYAAHALDVIERQTGYDASLEQMLSALVTHADGRMRWARITGHREEFILFRDLSMISYREPVDTDDDEAMAQLDIEAGELGRAPEYEEEEMHQGLLPIALMLDLGFQPHTYSGIVLRLRVDDQKTGGESLKITCREEAREFDITSPAVTQQFDGLLRSIFERIEENMELLRTNVADLPPICRPAEADMQGIEIEKFEQSGLWSRGDEAFYWPPYLSHPVTKSEDTDKICDTLKSLGEMALWAYPELPDTLSLTILSAMSTDDMPTFSCAFPVHMDEYSAKGRLANEMLDALQGDFTYCLKQFDYDIPVGHQTGFGAPTSASAVGLPLATIEIQRPGAHRALTIDEEYPHSFSNLPGYVDPEEAVEKHEALLQQPSALGFEMASRPGEIFTLDTTESVTITLEEGGSYGMTVAGGPQADVLMRLVSRVTDSELMDEYVGTPYEDNGSYTYSLLVGECHDVSMRRPLGYMSVSGRFVAEAEKQVGGQIQGHDVITFTLEVHLDRLQLAMGQSAAMRQVFLAALIVAIKDLLYWAYLHAEAQGRHFETDIVFGRSLQNWHHQQITEAEIDFLQEAAKALRKFIANESYSRLISIRDVDRSDREDHAA